MKESFTNYITKESVVILHGENKAEVLDELISRAADISKLDREQIYRLVWKRERMMTTGVGNGLALPHIRINNIPDPVILIGSCVNPIEDYQSQDGLPVQVIVFILAADANQEAYLQLLGSVSRRMRDKTLLDEIIANNTRPAQILKLVKGEEGENA